MIYLFVKFLKWSQIIFYYLIWYIALKSIFYYNFLLSTFALEQSFKSADIFDKILVPK